MADWHSTCGTSVTKFDGSNHATGEWTAFEYHYKTNTSGANGVFEFWIDNVLVFSKTNLNFGGGRVDRILFPENNKVLHNTVRSGSSCWYYDQDDFAFSTTGRIGPLGGGGGDTTAPTVPTNLQATAASSSQINLAWTASTDAVGVTGYNVYRSSVLIGSPSTNSFSDTGLSANTQYNYTVAAYDAVGNASVQSSSSSATTQAGSSGQTLLTEPFDTASVSSRGWVDGTTVTIDSSTKYAGAGSLKLTWANGQSAPTATETIRHAITPTDEMTITQYWRFNTDWMGSGYGDHPHLMYFLSDLDALYSGLAYNYLDTYIEPHALVPRVIMQDGRNANTSLGGVPNNITATTETRDVAGCNGCLAGSDCGSSTCYSVSPNYYNGRSWDGSFTFSKNVWYKVTTHLKMNSISGGRAVADGVMRVWVDNTSVLNNTHMVYRTNQHPTMKWATVVIGAYIGNGSPQAQTMWVDELVVSIPSSAPSDTTPPASPTGLSIN